MAQQNNDALASHQEVNFLNRNDILNRWGNLTASYQTLPMLRAYWPGGAVGPGVSTASAGGLLDQSGAGTVLIPNGVPLFDYDATRLIPYVDYNGTTAYHGNTDAATNNAFDILGTEVYVAAAKRGLTIGLWLNPDVTGVGVFGIMGKYLGAQISYLIFRSGAAVSFTISTNGAALVGTVSSTLVLTAGSWSFIVGRWIPSTETAIFHNTIKTTNTTGIPATIWNSTTNFEIARYNGANYLDGKFSSMFVCAGWLSDDMIESLYEQGRILYQ